MQPSVPLPNPAEFVLHPSVALGWRLDSLPYAEQAITFRSEMRAERVAVMCVQDIEFHVLELLADAISKVDTGSVTAWPLADDVLRVFASLKETKSVVADSNRMVARGAFQIAARYGIPFTDAMYVVVARGRQLPLLLADRQLYARLLAIELSGVRVTLLQDYIP